MSVRNYAILWPKSRTVSSTAGGGNELLSTGQHSLDGGEHSAATATDRLQATTDHSGLLRPLSGNPDDALRGDGSWGSVSLSGVLTSATGERHVIETITAGASETLDFATANWFDVTLTEACALSFSNPPDSGVGGIWTIILRGEFDVTWDAAGVWRAEDGTETTTPPTMTGTLNVVVATTLDGGTSYGLSLENGSNGASAAATDRRILLADGHATPFVFTDLLQMDDGSDFLWSD